MAAIIVTGNIASGKSSASHLLQEITGYDIICLDKFRLELYKAGMHGIALERAAEKNCLASNSDQVIYESTGTTLFYKRMMRELFYSRKLIHIHISTKPELCEYRFRIRNENQFQVAPPYNGMTVKQSIRKNNMEHDRMMFDYRIDNNRTKLEFFNQIRAIPWKSLILK